MTNASARRAPELGATIAENFEVTAVDVEHGRVRGVRTSDGAVAAPVVINERRERRQDRRRSAGLRRERGVGRPLRERRVASSSYSSTGAAAWVGEFRQAGRAGIRCRARHLAARPRGPGPRHRNRTTSSVSASRLQTFVGQNSRTSSRCVSAWSTGAVDWLRKPREVRPFPAAGLWY